MDFGFGDANTIVVCPSLSFPVSETRKITGIQHYEERMLFVVLALRDPGVRIVYLSSVEIHGAILDYYLGFLEDPDDARARLHPVALGDPEPRALTAKLLDDADAIARVRAAIGDPKRAFLVPFNVTAWEAELCRVLGGIALYGPAPSLVPLGSKSGGRRVARDAGVPIVHGAEDLTSERQLEAAIGDLLRQRPQASAVVIKLNNGFSGQGNAIIDVAALTSPLRASPTVFCAEEESWDSFARKIAAEGAVVEELLRSPGMASPSVQLRALPSGAFEVVSTHDQVLAGPDDQVYVGCRFPARAAYRSLIRQHARRIAEVLARRGVVGSFGVDFLVLGDGERVVSYMSEINLRVGGTTHPFAMARLATGGTYDPSTDELVVRGRPKCYVATDNLKSERYVGLEPFAVIDAVEQAGLGFDASSATGVTLHLLGALGRHGKMGATCIADAPGDAESLYAALVATLDRVAASRLDARDPREQRSGRSGALRGPRAPRARPDERPSR
jgi:hypothetical protein